MHEMQKLQILFLKQLYEIKMLLILSACSLEIITTEGLNKILEKSNSNNSKTWFTSVFLSHKYSLISIILSVILTAICTILIQKLFKKTKSNYEKKLTNSLKNCNKIVDLGNGIYINYDVYISDFDVTQKN